MKTILCPRCFVKTELKDLAWGCASSDCEREAIPTSSTERRPVCAACSNPLTMRFCPECGFQIDQTLESFKNLPISIAGSQGAGKSHFLSILINEIRRTVGSVYSSSLLPIGGDDTMNQYNELYYKPIFEDSICVSSTEQDYIRPLIYSLVFNEEAHGKTSTITFYDACGSNFRSERAMADYNQSIINSSGIILLIDPSQLPAIRADYIKRGREVLEDDFSSLLSRTISLIRGGNNKRNLAEKINVPIAICISKIDTLENRLEPSCYLNYPSRHIKQGEYDILDHECCSAETEALIESWGGLDITNQIKTQFQNYAFFGFSSLGTEPDHNKNIGHVAPHRVCDPFLWLMAKNEVIAAKRHMSK